jgi:hypothetical protein
LPLGVRQPRAPNLRTPDSLACQDPGLEVLPDQRPA